MHWPTSGEEFSQWYSYSIEMLPCEALGFELVQDRGDIGNAGAEGHVMGRGAHFVQVLEVAADNAAL